MLGYHINFNSKRRKLNIYNSIVSEKQTNESVINIHRINPNNVGDYYCGPHLYFDKLKNKSLDISDFRSYKKSETEHFIKKVSKNKLIIGGGGLLNIKHFKLQMELFEHLAELGKKIVIWGAGHNEINLENYNINKKYWIDTSKFGLVGTRDYSFNCEWVPCVSCLHSVFDRTFEETQEIGLLFNAKSIKDNNLTSKFSQFPISSNTTDLKEMIEFIGKSETLVTNSYHGMYWAILMNKKVVAVPATSKFLDFKYKVPIASFDNFQDKISDTNRYSGVLEECREINHSFAKKAFDYLDL